MKTIIIMISFMVSAILSSAQTYETSYTYDNAGNRINRKTVVLNPPDKSISEPSTDVEERFADGSIIVAPNPTEGSVFINFENVDINKNILVDLYDMNGRHLKTVQVNSERTEVNLSDNPAGTYIIKIQSGTLRKEFVIIKK